MKRARIASCLVLGLFVLMCFVSVAYSPPPYATRCTVWTTDTSDNPKGGNTPFGLGDTVRIHWDADGAINLIVYAPNGIIVDAQWTSPSGSSVDFVPSHGTGIYTVVVPSLNVMWPMAVGGFGVIPQVPLGAVLALCTMLGSVFLVRRIRIH